MQPILILQIIVSLILIVLVTIQTSDASIGTSFSQSTQTGFHTKRGPEKIIYIATIITSIIFLGLSILNILLWK